MKFEIDLNDILGDEGGVETLADSVRRQVVEKLTKEVSEGIRKQINQEVARVLSEELQTAVKATMPALLADVLNAEYLPVDKWGNQEREATTFRKQLIKTILEQMHYKKTQYSNERNPFTKAVDEVIEENVRAMKRDFDKKIVEMFQKEAFEYAMTKMAEKLQVKV